MHLDNWMAEVYVSEVEARWLKWCARLETVLGHDLDGSQNEDGYSLDGAYEMWRAGLTVGQARSNIENNKAAIKEA